MRETFFAKEINLTFNGLNHPHKSGSVLVDQMNHTTKIRRYPRFHTMC